MENVNTTFLLYDPDTGGFFREYRSVTPVDPHGLSALFSDCYRVFPGLSADCFIVSCPDDTLIIAHRLWEIPFNSDFTVSIGDDQEVFYMPYLTKIPTERQGVSSDEVTLKFRPQADQSLWLLIEPGAARSCLVAVHDSANTTHHPGIPNVFTDGRLCTGDAPLPAACDIWGGVAKYLSAWVKAWSESKFNDDLYPSYAEMACKFDTSGINIPVVNWSLSSPRIALSERFDSALTLVLDHAKLANHQSGGTVL